MPEPDTVRLRRHVRTLNALRIVFSILAVGLILFGLFEMREASRTRGWATASGTVVASNVNEFTGKDGRTYRPMVVFAYSVGSIRFMSSRIALHQLATQSHDRAAGVANKYPVGATVRVLYDPGNPEQAVLEPGSNFWIPIVAGGICSLLAVGVRMRRGRIEKQQAHSR